MYFTDIYICKINANALFMAAADHSSTFSSFPMEKKTPRTFRKFISVPPNQMHLFIHSVHPVVGELQSLLLANQSR